MKFTETIGDFSKRVASGGRKPPLRNFHEICEMLGVPEVNVKAKMVRKDAPKPMLVHKSNGAGKNSWYNPVEFKAWWKKVQDEIRRENP